VSSKYIQTVHAMAGRIKQELEKHSDEAQIDILDAKVRLIIFLFE
jgi:hypothetical protein